MSLDKEMPLTNLAVSGKDALQQLGLSVRKKNSCAQIWALLLMLPLLLYLGQTRNH